MEQISLHMLLTFTFLGVLFVITIQIKYREFIPQMTSMVIAMALSMSFGLFIGYISGVLFSGDLFFSTILGMILGMITGFLSGLPSGLLTVIEGMFSGIMGGMMGAMLGEMINPRDQELLLKILFFMCFSTILLLLGLIQAQINMKKNFNNLLFTMVLYGFVFLSVHSLSPFFSNPSSPSLEEKEIVVEAGEFTFTPGDVSIEAGEVVNLSLVNTGKLEHDLEIINLPAKEMTAGGHSHDNANPNIHLHTNGGESQTVSFIAAESGTYQFICTLPGHKEAGMFGTFKVI
ncbi:plastocyanin/azurin family copper-binding protein [Halobacillus sp. Marseille-P3879]|uniref:cupredoxin domain-containing protein n=1 Tax=Halobacillus sp. Marseille-P3879 TaxID=2045014 RepID=UPI000C7B7961|nr:plastocyanin/azurin family copper-binding protein [Halobacillus sp. Marseille-P3879]